MNKFRMWTVLFIGAAFLCVLIFIVSRRVPKAPVPSETLESSWRGYKKHFITEKGRVKRPKFDDTVSEGQAYAMLRAVWMNDKEIFDRVYRWTEENLSRSLMTDDYLLAWHWKGGHVEDWMPASDADVDYALSLILAEAKWNDTAPAGLDPYGEKARKILKDILTHLTYTTDSGRLYLSPWMLRGSRPTQFPVNPSYYSPAHFRIFYQFTQDERWLQLVDTTYFIVERLGRSFNGQKGVGLIPDWVSIDGSDRFGELEGKPSGFGWEAVRVIFRLGMDVAWFDSVRARKFLGSGMTRFIEKEWNEQGAIYCEYHYDGSPKNTPYENPLFYAAYYVALSLQDEPLAPQILEKVRSYLVHDGKTSYYLAPDEYYVNSWAWMAEGFREGLILK